MELYILDNLLRRVDVVDRFVSLIWTERVATAGDFQLIVNSNVENRQRFAKGTWLALNESRRVMRVEEVLDATDEEGRKTLKITGPSFEDVLNHRIAMASFDVATTPRWVLTGKPADILRKMFHDICVLGTLDPGDVIPFIHESSDFFPDDTIAEPSAVVTIEVDPKPLYEAMTEVAAMYDLGFRIVRDFDTSKLYFDVFAGVDRTTKQDDYDAVIFSPEFDNLEKTSELSSVAASKNVAYVISPTGSLIVYPLGTDPTVEGFERRVLLVTADDITSENTTDVPAALTRRGLEQLAKYRGFSAFDGELNQNAAYRYGKDYNLGDLTEMRNTDSATNEVRVTEQIFVSDDQGERSYPTVAMTLYIQPGTWAAEDFNKVWADYTTEHWADL